MKRIGRALWQLSDFVLSAFGYGATVPAKSKADAHHTQWLIACLEEIARIQVGTHRNEVDELFASHQLKNGGRECFCFRKCPLIQIEIAFIDERVSERSQPVLQRD